ncbi:hypothetical protein [Kutzneria sp. 744]|uniref:hypothetical protein n=1 Tax=Kutzneria sp. (strain 744) TaxID=345341 RepID=UPI0004AF15AF|nr:hypothetical protein [Kutzneria sp. 744]
MVPLDLRHTRERERALVTTPGTVRVGGADHAARRPGDGMLAPQWRTPSDHTELTEQG